MSRVLIVDDNETMRSGVALVVERMSHDAVSAASGAEALQRLSEEPCDLVITDYRMREMDGLQVLEAVKSDHPDTDVIIITAYGTIEIAVEAMKRGAVDFITKPFPPEALELKVDRILGHRADRLERRRLHVVGAGAGGPGRCGERPGLPGRRPGRGRQLLLHGPRRRVVDDWRPRPVEDDDLRPVGRPRR